MGLCIGFEDPQAQWPQCNWTCVKILCVPIARQHEIWVCMKNYCYSVLDAVYCYICSSVTWFCI